MVDISKLGDDEKKLAELGYKQELSRTWSGFSNFAISFSIISILAGCFTTFYFGWNNGGPIAISLGWPLISAFILIIGFCLSELVSAYPTSGGIYWWASKLGSTKAGYYTGWLNLVGLVAIVASVAYGAATFLDYSLSRFSTSWAEGYSLERVFVLFAVILVFVSLVNIFSSHLLAIFNNISVWWHVIGASVVVLILVFFLKDGASHWGFSDVFTGEVNNTGGLFEGETGGPGFWFYVLPLGFLLTQYTITGYDASAHLSEETHGAANAAAKGIWQSIFYSAIGGWILLLAFLFAVQDADAVTAGGGGVQVIFDQALDAEDVRAGPADRHHRSALLHDRVPHLRLADALRVQPRRRGPWRAVLVAAQLAEDSGLRGARGGCHRVHPHPAGALEGEHRHARGADLHGDRILRGGVHRCARSLPGLRDPHLLPVEGRQRRSSRGRGTSATSGSGWHRWRSARSSSRRSTSSCRCTQRAPQASCGVSWVHPARTRCRSTGSSSTTHRSSSARSSCCSGLDGTSRPRTGSPGRSTPSTCPKV